MKTFELTEKTDPRCIEYYINAFPRLTLEQQEQLLTKWLTKYPPKTIPNYGK